MRSKSFRDIDEFSASVCGVDADVMLQNPGRHLWSIDHVDLREIHIQLVRLGSGIIAEGESWSNGYLLFMLLKD